MREEKKNIYNFSQIVFCFFLMDKIGKGIDQSIYQKKNEGHWTSDESQLINCRQS